MTFKMYPLILTSLVALMVPVPALHIPDLVRMSNVIVVGKMVNLSSVPALSIPGNSIPGKGVSARIEIAQVLKGNVAGSTIDIQFVEPDEPIGYRSAPSDITRIFFLKQEAGSVQFASPYVPSIASAKEARAGSSDATDRVYELLARLLEDETADRVDRLEAISWLLPGNSPIASATFQRIISHRDSDIALRSAAALLPASDSKALALVEQFLTGNLVGVSDETYSIVVNQIRAIKDEQAIPFLSRLSARGDGSVREKAVHALRSMRSQKAVPSLIRALDDDEFYVRYDAVIGLAELTGLKDFGPSIPLFTEDEQRFLTFWKEWAKARK